MKSPKSATVDVSESDNGQLHIEIRHEQLSDVSSEMLRWWFQNLDGVLEHDGGTFPRHFVWHPLDHIYFSASSGGPIQPGHQLRIIEAFNRNPEYMIDVAPKVGRIDSSGAEMQKTIGGIEVFRLGQEFREDTEGVVVTSQMRLGTSLPVIGKLFNQCVRPRMFSDDQVNAWIRHMIEELGNLEHFLPELYASER